jgi:hypothetical protein
LAKGEGSPARTPRWLSHYACAQVAVLLLFGPYLANLTTRAELVGRHWRVGDAIFLIALLVALAMACVAVEAVSRRCRWPGFTRFLHHGFVLAVGGGILANLAFYVPRITPHGMPMDTAWLLLFAVVGYSMATGRDTLVLRTRQLCQILSPLIIILPVHLLNCETYPSAMDPIPPLPPVPAIPVIPASVATGDVPDAFVDTRPDAVPVYLFVFDMWSHERTLVDGRIRDELPHVAALADQATLFREAYSPGTMTVRSIPRLLFDTDLPVTTTDGRVGFDDNGAFVAPQQLKSLFRLATPRGYRAWVVGFGLPYRLWLNGQIDVCRGYHWCQWYPGDSILERAGNHVARAMRYWTDPWARTAHSRYHLALDAKWAIRIHDSITRDILHCLRTEPANTIALFHCPFPHYPYVQDDGTRYRSPMKVRWDHGNLGEYELSLRNLDRMIGRFVTALKEANRYDEALLVLTADHEWMFDPARKAGHIASPLTRVPLIVKLPRQQHGRVVDTRFETRRLHTLLRHTLDPAARRDDPEGLLARVLADCERHSEPPRLTGR